jgi:tetratricopeptide (TPR) repeat protein
MSIRSTASSASSAIAASSSQWGTVLARIDSLWDADAGLGAHELIRQHIEGARVDADSLFLLDLLFREGRLLAALNHPLEAEPVLREGMLLADALNEPLLCRACLRWLGVAYIGRGRLEEVLNSFEHLLRLAQESGDRYHEGYAWMGLAYYDWRKGRAGDAREKYTRSVHLFRELGQVRGELWALTGLNNALTMLGAYDEALDGNRRIIDMGRESGSREVEALGHNNLGVLLFSLGDPGEALSHFQQAAELQEQRGNRRDAIIAGQNVCICEIALGRTREASRRLRYLLETSRESGYVDVQVGLLKELAYAHLQQGDRRTAARMFREALSLLDVLTPKHECEILIGLSEAMAGIDSTRAALQLLHSNAAVMLELEDARIQFAFRNEMAERLLDEDFPREALEAVMVVEEHGEELGLTGYRLQALPLAARAVLALEQPDSALALLRRGVELWEVDRGLPLDPEWREQRSAAARDLFAQLTWLLLRHPTGRPREQRIREAFDVLQAYKARTLLERMLGPGGREVPGLQEAPVTLGELQADILRQGELLLDFIVGPDNSLLFACTPHECRALVLPGENELNRKLHLFHELLAARPLGPLSSADRESIASTAYNLSGLLFISCADMIADARHLIVVPDGALNLLPVSILLHGDGTGQTGIEAGDTFSSQPGDRHMVSRVPAATVLAWLRRGAGLNGDAEDHSGLILALASRSTDRGEILSGAKEEIGSLVHRYDGVTTELELATAAREEPGSGGIGAQTGVDISVGETSPTTPPADAALSAAAFAGFDIIHFAAHSTVDDQSPWRSAIHLDVGTGQSDRLHLRASEIAGWKLPARLVVLSSCESARGRILSGEGVQGLTSAFLSAGVPAVLATLWPVDDEVTVEFMTTFYEALHEGESVSAAVQRAQRTLRGRSRTAHPFYWAGFVLTGEGELHVDLITRPSMRPLWGLAVLCPLFVWLVLGVGRKKYRRAQ